MFKVSSSLQIQILYLCANIFSALAFLPQLVELIRHPEAVQGFSFLFLGLRVVGTALLLSALSLERRNPVFLIAQSWFLLNLAGYLVLKIVVSLRQHREDELYE